MPAKPYWRPNGIASRWTGRPSSLSAPARLTLAAVPLLIVPVLFVLAVVVLIPLSIVQRYRMGTSRQRARGWLVAVNLVGFGLSVVLFLVSATVTSFWIPDALGYTAAGLAAGAALGLVGLVLTRWEPGQRSLYYTPNRWLVLSITLVVSARVLYGFWRGWHTWRTVDGDGSWLAAAGVAGSMAAGGVVLGYYFVYWMGVQRRLRTARSDGRRW